MKFFSVCVHARLLQLPGKNGEFTQISFRCSYYIFTGQARDAGWWCGVIVGSGVDSKRRRRSRQGH